MSTKIYHVYRNDLLVDTLLVTDKELSEINIKDVIPNVETYEHYQDEYENDFYKINDKDIVSFMIVEESENVVIDTDKEEREETIGVEELKEKYYNICLKVEFNSNECAKNRELCEYFTAQMRLIEDLTDMDLSQVKEKAFQKAKADFKSYMCY
jgi:hypothetical protein